MLKITVICLIFLFHPSIPAKNFMMQVSLLFFLRKGYDALTLPKTR